VAAQRTPRHARSDGTLGARDARRCIRARGDAIRGGTTVTDAVLVAAVRTPVGKAPQGQFRFMRPDDLAALVLKAALDRVPGLEPAAVDDVVMGCAMPEAEQGMNVARIASLRAGVPHSAAAVTVNRFCASGLEAIACAVD